MVLAELNTEHFQFKALAGNEREAKMAVVGAFQRHLMENGSTPRDWADAVGMDYGVASFEQFFAALQDWYGINTYDFGSDNCVALRDGEEI